MSPPSIWSESFPPKAQWSVDQIPDMTGKVCCVTGGYGGVGLETTKALLNKNAKVYILGRSESKFTSCLPLLPSTNPPEFIQLDLGSIPSILQASKTLISQEPIIDCLFCSAGVMFPPPGSQTSDGYDLEFGTNVIGHWLLTKQLLEPLTAAGKQGLVKKGLSEKARGKARVVFTSSSGHHGAPKNGAIDYETLKVGKDGKMQMKVKGFELYGQSKIGDIIIANEFNRRYGDDIIFSSCNPGNLETNLARHISFGLMYLFLRFVLYYLLVYPASYGALTQLYAATSPLESDSGGKYFVPWAREGKPRADAEDVEVGRRLWEWLEEDVIEGKIKGEGK